MQFLLEFIVPNNFLSKMDIAIILTPSCLSRLGALKHIHGDLVRSLSKFDLRSRSFGDPDRS